MLPFSWRNWLSRLTSALRRGPQGRAPIRRSVRPALEGLEDRVVPAVTYDVEKSGPFTITAGSLLTYQLTLSNVGTTGGAPVVQLSDQLPSDYSLVSATILRNDDGFIYSDVNGTPTFNTPNSLPPNNTNIDIFQITVSVDPSVADGTKSVDNAQVIDSAQNKGSASFTTTVTTSADVNLVKTNIATTVTAGSTTTYTLTLTNLGPSDSQGVTLTDALPAGMSVVSTSISGLNLDAFTAANTANSATFTGNIDNDSAIRSDLFYVIASAASSLSAGVVLTNQAVVTATTEDPNITNNTATLTTSVTSSFDLAVTKTGPGNITAGTSVTYTLTLNNFGPSDVLSVSLTDVIPGNLTLVTESIQTNNDGFSDNSGGGNVLFTSNRVKGGNSDVFLVTLAVPATLSNGVTAVDVANATPTSGDSNTSNNSSTITSTVTTSSDLAVVKTGPASGTITAGTTFTYTLTATNTGPSNASNVTLTDTIPSDFTVVTESQISGPDSFTTFVSGHTVTFNALTMAVTSPGATDVLLLVVSAPPSLAAGTLEVNTAAIKPTDGTPLDNASSITDTIATSADLSVSKTGQAKITAGSNATYTITLTNFGPSNAANVSLTDAVPSAETIVSEAQISGPDTFNTLTANNTLTFTASTVAPSPAGNTDVFQVVVSTPSNLASGTTETDTATVTPSDSSPADNTATFTSTVTTAFDLAVVKTGPAQMTAGASTTYTLTLINSGPSNAPNVALTDVLPNNLTIVSESQFSGSDVFTTAVTGNTVTFSTGSMLPSTPGNTDVLLIVVTSPSNLPIGTNEVDTATVKPNDSTPNDNVSSITSTITTSADLSITKTGPAQVTAGTTITYTITATNNGPSDAQAVSVTDALPPGFTLITESIQTNNDGFVDSSLGGNVLFKANTMVAGNKDVFLVTAAAAPTLAAGGTAADTATITSGTTDPTVSNNTVVFSSNVTTFFDLAVVKNGPAQITAGSTVTYSLTLSNVGPSNANGVTLTDTVPANLTLVSESQLSGPDSFGTVVNGTTVSFTAATMAPSPAGNTDVLLVVVSSASNLASGTPEIDVAKIVTPSDSTPADNTVTFTSAIATSADLAVTKTGPVHITAGGQATYTITLNNLGPSDAQNVSVSDVVPSNLTLVNESILVNNDSFTNNTSGTNVLFKAATVVGGHSDVFLVTVAAANTLTTGTTAVDVAKTTDTSPNDPNLANNNSTLTSTITAVADLGVAKTGPSVVTAGSTVTYTLTLTNAGPSATTNVTLTDALPANMRLVSESQKSGPDSFSASGAGLGATATFIASTVIPTPLGNPDILLVVVAAPSNLANNAQEVDTATVTPTDNNPGNNTATFTSTITTSADLAVSKVGPATITAGTTVTYTITLNNNGPSDAQNVSVTDALPGNLNLVSESVLVNNDGFTNNTSGNNVLFQAGAVTSGHSDVFLVTVAAPGSLSNGSTSVDSAAVSASSPNDPNVGNNVSNLTSTIVTSADLAVAKTGPSVITAGTTATYTITFNNLGPSNAQNVRVTDTLPGNLSVVSTSILVNHDGFANNSSGNNVVFQAGTVFGNSSDVFLVTVAASPALTSGTTVVNAANTGDTSPNDPNLANNSSSLTSTITAIADLAISKTGPATITAGTTITYTLTLNNSGPSNAQNVTVSDVIPSGLPLVSESIQTNNDGFVNTSSVNAPQFIAPSVAAGSSDVFLVVFAVPSSTPSGTKTTDTGRVTDSGPSDPNLSNNSAALTSTVATAADIAVVKTGPPVVTAGTTVTYQITLTNNGPSDAQSVTLSDVLPGNLTLVTESVALNADSFLNNTTGRNVQFQASTVLANSSDVFNVVVSAPSSLGNGSTAVDTASGSTSTTDTNANNNSSTLTSTISASADLAVSKSGPTSVTAGTTATYTLTFANNGPSDAQNVSVTDTLPSGMTLVSATQINGPDSFVTTSSSSAVTFSSGTIVTGHTDLFRVVAKAAASDLVGALLGDVASAGSTTSDGNAANNTFTLTSTVATSADLSVSKTGPATVTAGTTVTYTLTLSNGGPSDARAVTLSDALPAGMQLIAENAAPGNPDPFTIPVPVGTTATFTAADVAAGNTDLFTVVAKALSSDQQGTTLTDTEKVSSTTSDTNQSNNTFTLASAVVASADLAVTKTGTPNVTAGGTATYTFTLVNNGPSDAQNVAVTDLLPAGVSLVSETQISGPDVFTQSSANNVDFTAQSVGAGHTDVFQAVVKFASNLPSGATLTDAGRVTSTTTDPNSANNTSPFTSTVTTAADLSVTKTGPTTVTAGATVTYTITLTDNGPSDAQAVSLTDALPGNLTLITESAVINPDSFVNTSVPGAPSFAAVSVAAGHSDVFQVVVSSASSLGNGSMVGDSATASSATTDLVPANNTRTISSTVTTSADLAVAVTGPAGALEAGTFTYTVTLTNSGPSDAQTVTLTDALPAGLTFVSSSFAVGTSSFGGGAVTDSIATVAAGATLTGIVVVTAAEDGSYSSTAAVTAATADPTTSDNATTITTSVAELPIAITVTPPSGSEFSQVTNAIVATFTHDGGAEAPSVFGATINWGDGSSSAGTIVQVGSTYQVLGTHTFSADGSSLITVTVSENGSVSTATAVASIGEAPLPPDAPGLPLDAPVNEGLDETFRQQPTGSEILLVEQGVFLLSERLTNDLVLAGLPPTSASNDAWAYAWAQFNFLLNSSGIFGGNLPGAVNFIVSVLMQEAAQQPVAH